MEIYRVSFIGLREVENFQLIKEQIEEIVRDLIYNKEYVEFYVGRNGEFDIMVASVIKKAKRYYGEANSSLILVLPYPIANMDMMEKYYDEILLPLGKNTYYKSTIEKRNEWMIKNSDLLVAYVIRNFGGAARCLCKAQRKGLNIIQIKIS